MAYTEQLAAACAAQYYGRPLRVEVDRRDIGGARGWDWIKKGVPLRVEIGPRDIANNAVFVGRRDKAHNARKPPMPRARVSSAGRRPAGRDPEHPLRRARAFRADATPGPSMTGRFYGFFTPATEKARDSRRLCSCRTGAAIGRMRSQDQGGSDGHHPLHPLRCARGKRGSASAAANRAPSGSFLPKRIELWCFRYGCK
jgi:hypothetical protein